MTATTKRLTMKQWAEAEALWESGTVIYEDLAKRFGAAISTFERHFKKRAIVKGSAAAGVRAKVATALATAAVDEATVLANRIKETKEQHYTMASNLAKLTWNEILEAKRDGEAVSTRLNNLKALDAAMTVLKKAREERWAVLGLDRPDAIDPDELPELVISELTAEQIQELRDRDHSELDDIAAARSGVKKSADGDADTDDDEGDPDELVEEGG